MKLTFQLGVACLLAQAASAYKCSQNEILKKYNVDKYSVSHTVSRDTPPSTTKEDWWINLCEENSQDAPRDCNKNDILCGKTKVTLNDDKNKDEILTQLIDFPDSTLSGASENDKNELVVGLKDAKWGSNTIDASLTFVCAPNKDSNTVTSLSWQDHRVQIVVEGDAGCLKKEDGGNDNKDGGNDKDDKDDDKDKNRDGESDPKKSSSVGSWFLWLLTYTLLFALIYLLATSYMNTRGGNFREFREDFIDRTVSLASSLPQFTKEIIAKVLGRASSSQRGGYSAV
ncbi:LADA_0H04038g1_1 [Lachancea dasiensis]|uniref:Autophagy-related protein 27 n=1 Tax=Lachancea dasiensis TaxID=1072105 RepID=A0A1G4K0J7_9SACH|nr:LADA_0H04038g1_1 [Lachancea dasiensis]